MRGKNKENGEKTAKEEELGKKERKQQQNIFCLSENVNVPTGHSTRKFAVPGSKKACHGHAGTV